MPQYLEEYWGKMNAHSFLIAKRTNVRTVAIGYYRVRQS